MCSIIAEAATLSASDQRELHQKLDRPHSHQEAFAVVCSKWSKFPLKMGIGLRRERGNGVQGLRTAVGSFLGGTRSSEAVRVADEWGEPKPEGRSLAPVGAAPPFLLLFVLACEASLSTGADGIK